MFPQRIILIRSLIDQNSVCYHNDADRPQYQQVCSLYTCVIGGCPNALSSSIIWSKNYAIKQHACARRPLYCNPNCPGYRFLGHLITSRAIRPPTQEWNDMIQEYDASDVGSSLVDLTRGRGG